MKGWEPHWDNISSAVPPVTHTCPENPPESINAQSYFCYHLYTEIRVQKIWAFEPSQIKRISRHHKPWTSPIMKGAIPLKSGVFAYACTILVALSPPIPIHTFVSEMCNRTFLWILTPSQFRALAVSNKQQYEWKWNFTPARLVFKILRRSILEKPSWNGTSSGEMVYNKFSTRCANWKSFSNCCTHNHDIMFYLDSFMPCLSSLNWMMP